LKPEVLKPDVLKPDVLKPDVLWVYLPNTGTYVVYTYKLLQCLSIANKERVPKLSSIHNLKPGMKNKIKLFAAMASLLDLRFEIIAREQLFSEIDN
jgi:hypothetical protein